MTLPDWMTSSEGNGQLSLRIKASIGIIIFVAGFFGFKLTDASLNDLIDQLMQVATAIGTIFSVYQFVRGWIRANLHKNLGTGKFANQ